MFKGEISHTHCMIDLFKHESILQGKVISGGIEWNSGHACQDMLEEKLHLPDKNQDVGTPTRVDCQFLGCSATADPFILCTQRRGFLGVTERTAF